ncbi:MAG: hypothetical protein HQK60_13200 [Deltaproteobacteria bacterium]|nr:hypothetical protein [Deltaproteobacteria bacterium]
MRPEPVVEDATMPMNNSSASASQPADPEILSFTGKILEYHQGLVEMHGDMLHALLPAPVAEALDVPEEVYLGDEAHPLLYGAPLLDRLIGLATGEVPVVYGRIDFPYLKKEGFDRLLTQDVRFLDSQVRVVNRADSRTTYMVLVVHYRAMSDERKEGLLRLGLHESSGALVEELDKLWPECRPQFFASGQVPPHFPVHLEKTIASGMLQAQGLTELALADFLASMKRRLTRDVTNTWEYYDALGAEMQAGLVQPNLTEEQRQERRLKIEGLPREMKVKIDDLAQKYQVRVTLTGRAAIRLLVNVVQLVVDMKHRKLKRSVSLTWNPITSRLDPLTCERCQGTIRSIQPVEKNNQIVLCCPACSRRG